MMLIIEGTVGGGRGSTWELCTFVRFFCKPKKVLINKVLINKSSNNILLLKIKENE